MKKNTAPKCTHVHGHKNIIEEVNAKMPGIDSLYDLAGLFSVFGDTTRVRILFAVIENEVCVCDIADALEMTVSAVSHQLRVLKNANLVRYRREGRAVYYSIADEHVRSILNQGLVHIGEEI